jgi:phosphomannomutase
MRIMAEARDEAAAKALADEVESIAREAVSKK